MWILLPVNGSTMSSKLFRMENKMKANLPKVEQDKLDKSSK